MNITQKRTAAVLAGSVALASVAYGVGTQVDDGSATAADSSSTFVVRRPYAARWRAT